MNKCIAPDEIREGDLMAYVEGQAFERVKDHVARCPACAAEAKSLAHATRSLLASLYRVSCPATEALAQYQMKMLPAGQQQRQIANHLKTCRYCRAELRKLAGVDLPVSDAGQRFFDIARALIEAVLIPPRPGLAMAARGGERPQHIYQAGDYEIIVGIEPIVPSRSHWRVRGRVIRQGQAAPEMVHQAVHLVQQEHVISSEIVDELGYFVFENIAPGAYDLWLEYLQADVVVRDLQVETERS